MPKILFLEDDSVFGNTVKMSLELSSYEVTWCMDLRTAKNKILSSKWDLWLFDWNLPDGAAPELLQNLPEELRNSVPVIFLTSHVAEDAAVKAFSLGVKDFVRKPTGLVELTARIRRTLGETVSEKKERRFGDLVLDLGLRTARIGDEFLTLNPKEFDLLDLMVKRGDSIVTRETLIEVIDKEGSTMDRNVDSHLSHIRAKIKKLKNPTVKISAVYGVGYKLEKGKP